MSKDKMLVLATEHRIAAAQCKKAGFRTISQVNIEMAEWYERRANSELVLDNTEEE